MVVKKTIETPSIKPSAENRAKLFQSSDFVSITETFTRAKTSTETRQQSRETTTEEIGRAFTQEEFVHAWKDFTASQLGDNAQAFTAFEVAQLAVLEDGEVQVIFPSETQSHYFNDLKGQMAEHLRNKHDISGVKYIIQIARQDETKASGGFFTDKEKFEWMREKNPALDELRKKFNLEIPY